MKVALTGPVQLELIAPYFAKAGYGVAMPGEMPDVTYDVTSHEKILAEEVPGFYDPRLQKLAGCPYSLAGIEAIVEEFGWENEELRMKNEELRNSHFSKKVLAVDADNTLWHGILSEDGPDALVHCTEFQKGLKQLADDGVILVLLSKNDPGSIENLARRNSSFFTLHSSFSACRVNWSPKPGNLVDVCRELNLGLDSVVFVDDNPHERAMMKAHLPEVAVAPWGGWGNEELRMKNEELRNSKFLNRERQLIRRLREYFFSDVGKTAEDKLRGDSYANLKRAEETLAKFATHDDYLKSLGLWVEARPAEERDLDRLAQMAGKTNQFNCTTLRRTRAEFADLICPFTSPAPRELSAKAEPCLRSKSLERCARVTICGEDARVTSPRELSAKAEPCLRSKSLERCARVTEGENNFARSCFVFRAGDRFGEQGIVCYAIIDGNSRRITDFVMSCRAMGRTLECFAYEWLSARLGYRPAIDFVPTAKNGPAREFVDRVNGDVNLKTYFTELAVG